MVCSEGEKTLLLQLSLCMLFVKIVRVCIYFACKCSFAGYDCSGCGRDIWIQHQTGS
jgi:hypothetical protein